MSDTTNQVKPPPNPTGKGGFQDHPELRSPGGWKKENVFSYQFKRFMNMSKAEFQAFQKHPPKDMTMAESLAYNRIAAASKSLPDFKEVADRTEGKANQAIDITSDGQPLSITTVSFKDLA